jgi:hypothetical protein
MRWKAEPVEARRLVAAATSRSLWLQQQAEACGCCLLPRLTRLRNVDHTTGIHIPEDCTLNIPRWIGSCDKFLFSVV